jgi:CDP-4-dehydro-6-deoxyglucose reductase, E3
MTVIHTVTLNIDKEATKSFDCSERESILHAGLRAGLPMRYKCTNGTCGECRSRLINGRLQRLQPADSPLSQLERESGWFLSCTHTPKTTLEINAPLFTDSVQIPHQTVHAKVKKIEQLQPGLAQLILRTPRSNTFQFLAGQDVVLSHLSAEHRYPIASCPCNGMELEFHIHQRAHDRFSQLLFSSLKRGERITINGPRGHFLLDERSNRHLIFIAWERGFAPIRSLIDHFISLEMDNPVSLYRVSSERPYLHNHAKSWHAVLEQFDYQWIKSKTDGSTRQLITQLTNPPQRNLSLSSADFYIAAPAEQLIELSEQLITLGIDESKLHGSPL